jgi:hypothetical protein
MIFESSQEQGDASFIAHQRTGQQKRRRSPQAVAAAVTAICASRQFHPAKRAEGRLEEDKPLPARRAHGRDRVRRHPYPTNRAGRRKKQLPETANDIPYHHHSPSTRTLPCRRPRYRRRPTPCRHLPIDPTPGDEPRITTFSHIFPAKLHAVFAIVEKNGIIAEFSGQIDSLPPTTAGFLGCFQP